MTESESMTESENEETLIECKSENFDYNQFIQTVIIKLSH